MLGISRDFAGVTCYRNHATFPRKTSLPQGWMRNSTKKICLVIVYHNPVSPFDATVDIPEWWQILHTD